MSPDGSRATMRRGHQSVRRAAVVLHDRAWHVAHHDGISVLLARKPGSTRRPNRSPANTYVMRISRCSASFANRRIAGARRHAVARTGGASMSSGYGSGAHADGYIRVFDARVRARRCCRSSRRSRSRRSDHPGVMRLPDKYRQPNPVLLGTDHFVVQPVP